YIFYKKGNIKFLIIFIPLGMFIINFLFQDRLEYKINKYFLNERSGNNTEIGIFFLMILFLFLFSIYGHKKNKIISSELKFLIILGGIYYILFFGMINFGFINRLALFFIPFVHILVVKIPSLFTNKNIGGVMVVIIEILCFIVATKEIIII
ncbi:hypothetical protein, partial [Turicibacter sanguinis]|uniref:hypothetical protein n=2 Tax=Turicibacter sanguinis TaxID=154288 RepID=UPI00325A660B